MAGIHFSFDNFEQLLALNIGLSERLDENRAESFTLLYCDFGSLSDEVVQTALESSLRNSDSVVNHEGNYFFVLPYTDKYGAEIVKNMFDEFFDTFLPSFLVSYPVDGESPKVLLETMQDSVSVLLKKDLHCLDRFTRDY